MVDDGYGCSRRYLRRFRNSNRQLRSRGKRFKKEDEMQVDDSTDDTQAGQNNSSDAEPFNFNSEDELTNVANGQVDLELCRQMESNLKLNA